MKKVLLSFFIICITCCSNAQNMTFEDNISNRQVYSLAMYEDILWLGADGGIVKFNKQTEGFSNYNSFTDSIIQGTSFGNAILYLDVSSSGELYTSGAGVNYYNGTYWFRYTSQNSSLPNDFTRCVTIDNDDNVWVGCDDYMCRLNNNTWVCYQLNNNPGLSNFLISACDFDSENTAWISTLYHGLYKIENDSVIRIDDFAFGQINSIKVDNDKILIGTSGKGLLVFFPGERQLIEYNATNSNITGNYVQYVYPDGDSYWLIGSDLMLFEDGNFTVYMDKDSVLNELILNRVLPDGDVLWLGTANDGLYKYDLNTNVCEKKLISNLPFKSKFKPFSVDSIGTMYQLDPYNPASVEITDVEGNSVKSVEDIDYFQQKYTSLFDSDTFNVFEKNKVLINFYKVDRTVVTYDSLWRPVINTIKEDRVAISNNSSQIGDFIKADQDNTIYKTSSEGGYWMYNGSWTKHTKENSAIPTISVGNLCFDNSGKLWFSAYPEITDNQEIIPGALITFNGTAHEVISISDIPDLPVSSAFISCIYIDSSNVLWMGISDLWGNGVSHGYGLFKYDGNSWLNYTTDNSGLSGKTINYIIGHESDLYIGTSGGGISVLHLATSTWDTYNAENSLLPWNTINSIDIDSTDSMYIYHYWNDVFKTGTDIELVHRNQEIEVFEDDIIVFPNPTTDILTVKIPGETSMHIKKISIYDISGKLLAINVNPANHDDITQISLKNLSLKEGIYFIEIITDRKSYRRNIILFN